MYYNMCKCLNKFQRMCGTLSLTLKGKTQLSTQIKFYKVMAVPVLMYGRENWSLNRSDKRKIEAAVMRFLRPMVEYTLWVKKRSSDIREQLGIFNINDKLTQYRIKWREHIIIPSYCLLPISCRSLVDRCVSLGSCKPHI